MSHGHLSVSRPGHALFVNGEGYHSRPVPAAQLQGPNRPLLAVFQVNGIDDTLTRQVLEGRFDGRRFGGIDHDGDNAIGIQPESEPTQVLCLIPTYVSDGYVQNMGLFLHLVPGHREHTVQVVCQQVFPEALGAVGVGALTDDEGFGIGVEGSRAVKG